MRRTRGRQSRLHGITFDLRQREQQMLCRHIFVLEVLSLFEASLQHPRQTLREPRLRTPATYLRQLRHRGIHSVQQRLHGHTDALQYRQHNAFLILQQRRHQMHWQHLRIAIFCGQPLRVLQCLLALYRQLLPSNCHLISPDLVLLNLDRTSKLKAICRNLFQPRRRTHFPRLCCSPSPAVYSTPSSTSTTATSSRAP